MADLHKIGELALGNDDPLLVRFVGGMLPAAKAVFTEDVATVSHTERLAWAQSIMTADVETLKAKARHLLRRALADNADLQTHPESLTDSDLQWIVNFFITNVATNS